MKAKKAMALLIFLVVVLASALPSGAQPPVAQPSIPDDAAAIGAQRSHDRLQVNDFPVDNHALYLPVVSGQQGAQDSASAWVGAQGGTIMLQDGTRLEIPPGALAAETLVTLAETEPPAPLPWGMISGDGYVTSLEPDGLTLGQPARLYIPLPPGADHEAGAIHTYDPEAAEWWLVGSQVEDDMAVAEISHFSSWEWLMCGAQSAADGLASFQIEGLYLEGDATNYLDGAPIPIDVDGPPTSLLFKVHDAHNAFGSCETAACGGPGTRIDLEASEGNQQIVLPPDYVPGTMVACQEGALPRYYYRVCTSDFTIKWPLPASFVPWSDPISFPVKAGVVSVDDRPAVPWCYRLYDEVSLSLEKRSDVCIPSLLWPAEGAVMDNGGATGDTLLWDFDWSDCEGATEYALYVKWPGASEPVIDVSGLGKSAYRYQCADCLVADEQHSGWTWRVRARVGGEWGNWSAVQTFDVEPSGSDAGNRPPFVPASPSPANGAFGVPVGNSLAWSGGDPDGDDVTYDVYLDPGSGMPQTLICNDAATPACDPGTLSYLAQVAWFVAATDEQGATSGGPLWTFTTQEAPGLCTPFRQIACGETHAWGNNSGGTISHIPFYACSSRDESGPEVTYRFVPDRSGNVVASLSGMSADLDLFLLDDVGGLCHADSCIAYGDASISFEAVGGATYYLVVDGYQGAISNYSLTVWCSCDERPYVPSDPAPGDGATEISVEADLNWSGGHPCTGEKVTYDVYLEASDSTPDVLVCDDATNPGCDPGPLAINTHYYWRVVAYGTNGPVAGPVWEFWTEQTPCTDPPYAPWNPSPANGATEVNVDADLSWMGGHPCAGEAVTYDVYLAAGDSTPDVLVCNDLTSPLCDPGTLAYGQETYWQVVAQGANGPTIGPVWTFRTGSTPCTDPPYIPSNPSPGDGATGVAIDADLSWTGGHPCAGEIVTYDVYLEAGDSTPDILVCDDVALSVCDPGTLAYGQNYYWRVVANGANGPTVGPVWSFQTGAAPCTDPPYIPSNPSPADGATEIAVDADLSWTGGHPCAGEAVTYDVYLAAGDSTPDVLVCNDVASPLCDPGTLAYGQDYYWRVVVQGANGPTVGPVWTFRTSLPPCSDPPNTPSNPSPADGATGIPSDADLSWTGGHPCIGQPVTYDVYLAAGGGTPTALVCNDVTSPLCDPGPLAYEQLYTWQVVANGANGPAIGPVWTFVTGPEPCLDPPLTPSNPAPADGARSVPVNASLSWSGGHPCEGETVTYDVYLEARDKTPDLLVCNDVTIPECRPGTLEYRTRYYWQVVANGANGPTIGPVWTFDTMSPLQASATVWK